MINFDFSLYWPLKGERGITQDDYFYWDKAITKNKAFSIQISRFRNFFTLIELEFRVSRCQDHAGVRLNFALLGLSFMFEFYDIRHWNYYEHRFMTEEEARMELEDWEATRKKDTHEQTVTETKD